MKIEVVTIGDELLLGYTIDTNAAHLARVLAGEGVEISRRTTCGDTADSIAEAVSEALDRSGAVITTGGLGPTSDDLTKPSIASLFGREMVLDEEHLAWMKERWQTRFQRPMPESNRQQAMLPAGARKLVNNHGSAPGIWLSRTIVVAGSRCCQACRAKCAECLPTHCCRSCENGSGAEGSSSARGLCAPPASASRTSPI